MTRRAKKPASAFVSIDDCNAAMRRIALLDIELEKIQGECDTVITMAKREAEKRAKSKVELKKQLVYDLAAFCEERKGELTAAGKTVEMLYGRLGWRLSPGELKLAKVKGERRTWGSVVALVMKVLGGEFIRVKHEVKKDEIKAAAFDATKLERAGLVIEQRDEWFYELDRTRALAAPGVIAGGSAAPAQR